MNWDGTERSRSRPRLNPLLIGAQCERRSLLLRVHGRRLNPLLIGAQCEHATNSTINGVESLNPLLIGAQCELYLVDEDAMMAASQSPFDRGSV